MKLLLTSSGITNESIKNALADLLSKPFENAKAAYIPTAANVEKGDKGWMIEDLVRFQKLGFEAFDIVDISALPQSMWLPRLEVVDVVIFGGGNTFHLTHALRESGFVEKKDEIFKDKVYVGVSAGSMVASSTVELSSSEKLYEEEVGEEDMKGLGFVDFYILPHLNSPFFPNVREESIRDLVKDVDAPVYALDDDSAVKVKGDNVEVISEGKYLKIERG